MRHVTFLVCMLLCSLSASAAFPGKWQIFLDSEVILTAQASSQAPFIAESNPSPALWPTQFFPAADATNKTHNLKGAVEIVFTVSTNDTPATHSISLNELQLEKTMVGSSVCWTIPKAHYRSLLTSLTYHKDADPLGWLAPELEPLRPLLGKTWETHYPHRKLIVEVFHCERTLGGYAVRFRRSKNNGHDGQSETVILWDRLKKSVIFHQFDGYASTGTVSFENGKIIFRAEKNPLGGPERLRIYELSAEGVLSETFETPSNVDARKNIGLEGLRFTPAPRAKVKYQ